MSNKLASTPQWKWMMQKQRGIDVPKIRELYYTGEVFTVPENEIRSHYPKEMRGNTYRVIGIGNPPSLQIIAAMQQRKMENKPKPQIDPGPQEKIDSSHWKSGHWKVAKIILRKDMDRADKEWITFGSKRAYRQYKLIEQFIEEKSQQNWDPDDDFATKYLIEYRKAFSDHLNTRVDWERRRTAINTINEVRDLLRLPTYNKL